MTLTRFFTRNIYIPLGGNRKGLPRTCLNIMIVFLISGMWHGAHPNFLLWGCLNGLLLVLERVFRRKDRRMPVVPAWLITFLIINCLWLLFRAGTISQWAGLMRNVLSFQGSGLSKDFTDAFFVPELVALLRVFGLQGIQSTMPWLSVALFMGAGLLLVLVPQNNHQVLLEGRKPSMISALAAAFALVWSLLCMSAESVFIYSGF